MALAGLPDIARLSYLPYLFTYLYHLYLPTLLTYTYLLIDLPIPTYLPNLLTYQPVYVDYTLFI